MPPLSRPPVEYTEVPEITFWHLVLSSWTMGCGNWGTRYERVEAP